MHQARPKNALTHRVVAKNIAQLVRVGRKRTGLSQSVIAAWLDLPLEHVQKIEKGQYRVSAEQWHSLCRLLRLDFEMIDRGYIDRAQPATLKDYSEVGEFVVPKRYAYLQGSSVRATAPFLKFVQKSLGEQRYLAYLRFKQIDPDYFHDYSHQLNVNFPLDVMRDMVQWGHLSEQSLNTLTHSIQEPETHGILGESYVDRQSIKDLLQTFHQHIQKYEVNCDYQIEECGHSHIEILVRPNAHMKEFHYRRDEVLNDLPCRYKAHYFESLITPHGRPRTRIEERECYFKGGDKCVYRVAI